MTRTAEEIDRLVESALEATMPTEAARIRALRVRPRCELRPWDYGAPGDTHPCWVVLEHPESNTAIVYSDVGFGPKMPWGLLFISGEHMSMGMDSSWFTSLDEAFRNSWASEEVNPHQEGESPSHVV